MRGPLTVNDRITIPERAIEIRAVRSSGPGGQNVNKVSSKIQLWIDLAAARGLTADERLRVRGALRSRIDKDGRLLVTSQRTRDQARNIEDAADRALALLRVALHRPAPRRPTRPSRTSVERRFDAKRRRAARLRDRDTTGD